MALLVLAVLALVVPGTALADFVHVVGPGESLSSIAATDGLTVDELAAANGLPLSAQLIAGSQLRIPPQGSTAVVAAGGSSPAGSYVVVPGDTLTAIAERAGTSVAQLAADNAIDPSALLPAGSVLRLPGSGAATANDVATADADGVSADGQPVGSAAEGDPSEPPYPTGETVTPGQVAAIAAADGVPPALAEAVADQESGFNNSVVSGADARGVMQILPGTWQWIQQALAPGGPSLAPTSALDNVRGGVLLLRSLLQSTGGDPAMAAAGYFQGLSSVRRNGVYPSTQRYVDNVMALLQRFGGG
ncbi:MAG: lytic transglycosylase [Solirubrobacteraceae bacterium]